MATIGSCDSDQQREHDERPLSDFNKVFQEEPIDVANHIAGKPVLGPHNARSSQRSVSHLRLEPEQARYVRASRRETAFGRKHRATDKAS
jgi:hypothetical protein